MTINEEFCSIRVRIMPLSFGLVALLIVIGFFVQDFNTDLSAKAAVYQKLERDLVQITD